MTGEQCQVCGNDYDPMRSCSCRWGPLGKTLVDPDIVLHEVMQLEGWLDEQKVPRTEDGIILSLKGRVMALVDLAETRTAYSVCQTISAR